MSNKRITIDLLTHNHDKIILPSKNNQKAISRKKDLQNKYENECIDIQLMDEYDEENQQKVIKACSWNIPRKNLHLEVIQNFVNRSQEHSSYNNKGSTVTRNNVVVAYIRDHESSAIILPNQMQTKCKPKPSSYYIIAKKQIKIRYDVLSSCDNNDTASSSMKNHYNGDTKFFLQEVPCYSANGLFQVQEEDIIHWIIIGLLQSDIDIQSYAQEGKDLEQRLEQIARTMEQNAYLPVYDEKGYAITGKKADEMKEQRYQELFFQEETLQKEYDTISETFRTIWKRREEALHIDIAVENHDKNIQKKDYLFEIYGAEKERYECIAVQKEDWSDVLLVAGTTTTAGDKESTTTIDWSSIRNFDLNSSTELKDYSNKQTDYFVDIAGIEIKRIKDGFGMHLQLQQQLPSFDFYHGLYRNDQRTGLGSWYTEEGMYIGGFLNDQPHGEGTLEYSTGDKIVSGHFEVQYPSHNNSTKYSSSLGPNPYLRGMPNGKEKQSIHFADGSMYEGTMENGVITGEGVYVNSLGERIEGTFDRGILVKGKKSMVSGETFEGNFIDGSQLDGYATIVAPRYSYQGYFDYGDKHGKGRESFLNHQRVFDGFYFHGCKTWCGEMKFGTLKISASTKNGYSNYNAQSEQDYKFKYNGPLLANHIISGGFFTEKSSSHAATINNKSAPKHHLLLRPSTYRFTNRKFTLLDQMIEYENKSQQKLKQKTQKHYQHDRLLRKEVIRQHKNIFDAQLQRCVLQINNDDSILINHQETRNSNENESTKNEKCQQYYHFRQLLCGPATLKECEINPGLRLEVKSLLHDSFSPKIKLKQVKQYAKSYGMAPSSHDCVLSEMIQCNFGKIPFKWKCIDINHLKRQVVDNLILSHEKSENAQD